MAKPRKKNQQRPSWFQKQIDRVGEEGLLRKQPQEIQRDAFNIVRDIARGNVTQRELKYLFTPNIVANVRQAILNEYMQQHTYYSSMMYVMQNPTGMQILETNYTVDPMMFNKVRNDTYDLIAAYTVILQGLDAMMAVIHYEYPDADARMAKYLEVYSTVQNQISRFRHKI